MCELYKSTTSVTYYREKKNTQIQICGSTMWRFGKLLKNLNTAHVKVILIVLTVSINSRHLIRQFHVLYNRRSMTIRGAFMKIVMQLVNEVVVKFVKMRISQRRKRFPIFLYLVDLEVFHFDVVFHLRVCTRVAHILAKKIIAFWCRCNLDLYFFPWFEKRVINGYA